MDRVLLCRGSRYDMAVTSGQINGKTRGPVRVSPLSSRFLYGCKYHCVDSRTAFEKIFVPKDNSKGCSLLQAKVRITVDPLPRFRNADWFLKKAQARKTKK